MSLIRAIDRGMAAGVGIGVSIILLLLFGHVVGFPVALGAMGAGMLLVAGGAEGAESAPVAITAPPQTLPAQTSPSPQPPAAGATAGAHRSSGK